jgi:2'-5' RNA ligase
MSLLRAFIAVEIPSEIHQAIEKQTATIRAALDSSLVRWVPDENIHLTLKFLGDV